MKSGKFVKNSRVKDITEQRFGSLVVVAFQESIGRVARWKCLCDCGREVVKRGDALRNGHTKSCGHLVSEVAKARPQRCGAQSSNWKGGRIVEKQGYVWLRVNDPNAYREREVPRTKKYELEHVVVMSTYLGRKLFSHETVHHKNGNRSDNTLDNLELWSVSQPRGQHIPDKTQWALEWLRQYAPERLK